MQDIRWKQRYGNFKKALDKLSEAVEYVHQQNFLEAPKVDSHVLTEVLKEGLIQRFEYTHELAWNVMKDFAEYQGNNDLRGSRDTIREAFKMKLIEDGALWMSMIEARNRTSHTYDEKTADDIFQKIITVYFPAMVSFSETMDKISKED